jgi:alkylated DNA repair dioxygenase AlkB
VRIDLPDGDVRYLREAFPDADTLFAALRAEVAWSPREIVLFGKRVTSPRLTAWYGEPGTTYTYSGLTLTAEGWTPALRTVRARVEELAGVPFDGVLCNLYRSGQDAMGAHSDDEPELGPNPVIASASFGATRRFVLRHKKRKDIAPVILALEHGSLLLMAGPTQHAWRHHVPREPEVAGERINLTFRRIASAG